MRRYVLDTNIYITADRDEAWAEGLHSFSSAHLPYLFLHAVVVQEMLAGALDRRRERLVYTTLVEPFEKRRRIVTPTYGAWKRAGRIMAALVQRKLMSAGGFSRSFVNDCLLAASCREHGLVLVTQNRTDFDLIARVEPITIEEPWPASAPGTQS